MKLFLPYPPSANKLWKPVASGRMVTTPAYKAWMAEAAWLAAMAARDSGRLIGTYKLLIEASPPTLKRRRDVDNIAKPTSDAIVKGGLVQDDSLCQEITVRWTVLEEPGLMVHVEPSDEHYALSTATARSVLAPSMTVAEYRKLISNGKV